MKSRGWLAGIALVVGAVQAEAQETKPLRWGGDKNGGAPYIYEDAKGKLVGFEVEFAEYLAKELGRTPVFVQNQWDNLPDLLKRENDIDIVLNGYEFSKERHGDTPTTVPYYIYSLRLITRVDEPDIHSWADLGRQSSPKKVGVLRGSAGQRYIESRFGDKVQVEPSETVTEMLDLVRSGQVDVTVQDAPAAAYYIRPELYPTLKVIDEPVGSGYYVILTRPGDEELRKQLNEAIRKAVRVGRLRELYVKHGLWNASQQRLSYLAEQPWPESTEEFATDESGYAAPPAPRLSGILNKLIRAAGYTVLLAVVSFPIAMLLGLLVAVGRVYGPWIVRAPLAIYVEVLRGTPLLLQLFVLFYLPSQLAKVEGWEWMAMLSMGKWTAAILGLALNYSANESENYRAGLLAVPRGQMEAALSLGLTPWTAIRHVVLPQAFRIVIPPVTNDFIALFKDTAICSTIMIVELTGFYYAYKVYPGLVVELAVAVGLLYLLMSYPTALLARRLELRMALNKDGART